MKIKIEKRQELKPKLDESNLEFGKEFTDHMFLMNYTLGQGWHDARIVPYGPIEMSPAAMVLHYAQETFEGLKAYKRPDGKIQLFRPEENFKRLNRSNDRMCIPRFDEDFAIKALKTLVEIDQDWVPHAPGTSLYIRPFIFATSPFIGVRESRTYLFCIILSPVGSYYPGGLAPTKMYIEDVFARTVLGGTGEAKCGGNYAGGLAAQKKAASKGFEQILWLDGAERKYIEEVGTSNVFFKIDGKFYTPELSGTILPGITRKSIIELLKSWGETVIECKMTIDELVDYHRQGKVEEVFATGTAAVISPIGSLDYMGETLVFHDNQIGEYSQKVYDELFGIQTGQLPDPFGWTVLIDE
ncbi:MAG: branched-chain amino acid aminotransferase [Eubacteriaceae bacterium]|jgi:branched-chain amino acid aminotransferase|nr:branched-chain amino acid aminotransferase [Eubacteriaceae bacterium]